MGAWKGGGGGGKEGIRDDVVSGFYLEICGTSGIAHQKNSPRSSLAAAAAAARAAAGCGYEFMLSFRIQAFMHVVDLRT